MRLGACVGVLAGCVEPGEPSCAPAIVTEAVGPPEAAHVLTHNAANNAAWAVGVGAEARWVYASAAGVHLATVDGAVVLPTAEPAFGGYPVTPALAVDGSRTIVVWVEAIADLPASRLVMADGPVGGPFVVREIHRSAGALVYPSVVAVPDGAVVAFTDRGADRLDDDRVNNDDALGVLVASSGAVGVVDPTRFLWPGGYVSGRDPTVAADGDDVVIVGEAECATCCPEPPCDPAAFRDPHLFVQRSSDGGRSWWPGWVPLLDPPAAGDDPSVALVDGQVAVLWRDVGTLRGANGPIDGPWTAWAVAHLSPGRTPVVRRVGSEPALAWVADDFGAPVPLADQAIGFSFGPSRDAELVYPDPDRVVQNPTLAVGPLGVERWWVDAPTDFMVTGAFRLVRAPLTCPGR